MYLKCLSKMNALIVLIAILQRSFTDAWTHDEQSAWPLLDERCGGLNQSPININRNLVVENLDLDIVLLNYDIPNYNFTVLNDGHTVVFTHENDLSGSRIPYLTGSAVKYEMYRLAQFHPHWADNRFEGSEHTIDGYAYPFETHFVHYNMKYSSLEEALGREDGVAVVGVFHKHMINNRMNDLASMANEVSTIPNQVRPISAPIRLRDYLPKNYHKFYTYSGSLTTPPCIENVRWIVLDHFSYIDSKQLTAYRNVIPSNYRHTQYRGNRLVEASFKVHPFKSMLSPENAEEST